MKRLLSIIFWLTFHVVFSQNGFTTYTTSAVITGLKMQTAFLVDNNGNKWIGYQTISNGNAGLLKYDNTNWTLYNQSSNPTFPSNRVTALAKDNNGNIWIGCDSGLVKFDGSVFTTYSTAQGLPMKYINCVEVVGNQIYVGTNKGLSRFDGISFSNYNVANGQLPYDSIKSIKAESSSVIWLGGRNRLIEFDINSSFTSNSFINNIIPSNAGIVTCIYIDVQNKKWLGVTNYGGMIFSGTSFMKISNAYNFVGDVFSSDIAPGPNNGVVYRYNYDATRRGFIEFNSDNTFNTYLISTNTFTNITFGSYIELEGDKLLFNTGTFYSNSLKPYGFGSFDKTLYTESFGILGGGNLKLLDINNVKAGITNRNFFHGFEYYKPFYEVPKGSGKSTTNGSALWIAGLDDVNQLHGAAHMHGSIDGTDFWPGPLDTINGSIDTLTSWNYDKIWKVSYTDINNFITAFNSGSVIATPDMWSWPAKGTGSYSRNLAPFVDYNNDGLYNPNDGDYPKIKGDQTLYFIYNDMLSVHSSSFSPMGIEVQGMAYAYGCPNSLNGNNELANTTFYDYKITNRSLNNYHNVYVGIWSDVKIGNNEDDYVGCNVADNYGYVYNVDSVDEDGYNQRHLGYGNIVPASGTVVLKGPISVPQDGVDNNNNGVIDEIDEDCKMSKFISYYEGESAVPVPSSGPCCLNLKEEYYTYLQGQWKDSTSIQCGSRGYGTGNGNTNWMYPGDLNNVGVNTDPNNTCGYWIEPVLDCRDKNYIISSGPFTLNAGQMQEVEYAFVTSFDSSSTTNSNLLSVAKLKTDMQKVIAFYNQANKPNCLQAITIGVPEIIKQNDFCLYPNPAKSLIIVSSTINGTVKVNYEIVDVLGKVVMQSDNESSDKFSININDLNSGIYFLRLQVNNSLVVKKFIKE